MIRYSSVNFLKVWGEFPLKFKCLVSVWTHDLNGSIHTDVG